METAKLNSKIFPSIVKSIRPSKLKSVTFVRPTVLAGRIKEIPGNKIFYPMPKIFSIREIYMKKNEAIPFHFHNGKEKLYITNGANIDVEFILSEDGLFFQEYKFWASGQSLIVNPKIFHAILFNEPAVLMVVTSSQDYKDIVWEPNAEELFLNKHLKG